MKITPLDISQQEFRRSMRGYDADEVDNFLDLISNEFEELIKENERFKDRIKMLEQKSNEYKEMEKTIENALISVEKVSEEIKLNAQKEAELIIKEAELKAEKIVEESEALSRKLREDIIDLKKQKQLFESKLRAMIEAHLKMLDYEQEFEEEEEDSSE